MIEPMAARQIAESKQARQVIEMLHERNEAARASVPDFANFPRHSWLFHKGLVEGTRNHTLTVLVQSIADIIELQVVRRYTRPMHPGEAAQQTRQNRRSVHANDKLLKLLEAHDADGAEAYWTGHLATIGTTLLGPDADSVVDLPD